MTTRASLAKYNWRELEVSLYMIFECLVLSLLSVLVFYVNDIRHIFGARSNVAPKVEFLIMIHLNTD